ncbi:Phosphonate ABC transporter phosphate-binding periplasmic component (TC 3.A.1.9.1) [uncultured Gammaproteobacteria bacterium]|nr:Phosphonate ABC transporter phosphate-binding periplasmic component (TC 3.A.1.9.1) [uncultured Gammaproteobacteria bacterium]
MKIIKIIIASLFVTIGSVYAMDYDLPKAQVLVVDRSMSNNQADKMILAARRYAAFWHTGKEKYVTQALDKDFIDLNLPKGRKQGIQGPLDASKWFRGVVPNLTASIKKMMVVADKVVLQLEFNGNFTGKFHGTQGQGQVIKFVAVDMYTIKNGKIKSNWHLEDNQTLMQQLNKGKM